MSKTLLIGHRGVGKTSLLKRISAYHKNSVGVLDLDELIEKGEGMTVSQIFSERGEETFRALEKSYLEKALTQPGPLWLAVGAGFELDGFSLPADVSVRWVRRPTDSSGRTFLDRPRLNSETSAFDEYLERYTQRNENYAKSAHENLHLDEGFDFENTAERKLLANEISDVVFDLTVLPSAFARDFASWYGNRAKWGVRFFELRDDLLSLVQIQQALTLIPIEHILLSLRSEDALAQSQKIIEKYPALAVDRATELGSVPGGRAPTFLSFHRRTHAPLEETLRAAEAQQMKVPDSVLKIALPLENFEELSLAHEWMREDQARRILLPTSAQGRWSWYRLWMHHELKLNFMREDAGSAPDQPTLLQVLRAQEIPSPKNFAAVLGRPVTHSRTPAEQGEFFAKRGWPVYQIDVSETEWLTALPFLSKLGLKAAAVTSPLKHLAFGSAVNRTPLAQETGTINTLWLARDGWRGENTDVRGFKALLAGLDGRAAVWGGGGTLSLVRSLIPGIVEFAARTGVPREGHVQSEPETLVWAVPRSRFNGLWPNWRPKVIIDLNYGDDSPGRELALKTGARYISGLAMFKAQAQGQREFWQDCEAASGGQ